jgi:hypothetical protein
MTQTTFAHRDLDDVFARLLGCSGLEYRDPNDGQSSDPDDKKRYQYALFDGLLCKRVLPPPSVGDTWRDMTTGRLSRRPPDWEAIELPRHWGLLVAWAEHTLGRDWPHPWSMGGSCAAGVNSGVQADPVRITWMRSRIEVSAGRMDWPQRIPCPHCWHWIVWAEAAYVPGYRICAGCHRHWQTDWPERGRWSMRPNGRRGWPY